MGKHTKEPRERWTATVTSYGHWIAWTDKEHWRASFGDQEELCKRTVNLHNACQDIDDPEELIKAVRELIHICRQGMTLDDLNKMLDRLAALVVKKEDHDEQ